MNLLGCRLDLGLGVEACCIFRLLLGVVGRSASLLGSHWSGQHMFCTISFNAYIDDCVLSKVVLLFPFSRDFGLTPDKLYQGGNIIRPAVNALPFEFLCVGGRASVTASAADEDLAILFGRSRHPAGRIASTKVGKRDDGSPSINRRQRVQIPRWSNVDLILSDGLAFHVPIPWFRLTGKASLRFFALFLISLSVENHMKLASFSSSSSSS